MVTRVGCGWVLGRFERPSLKTLRLLLLCLCSSESWCPASFNRPASLVSLVLCGEVFNALPTAPSPAKKDACCRFQVSRAGNSDWPSWGQVPIPGPSIPQGAAPHDFKGCPGSPRGGGRGAHQFEQTLPPPQTPTAPLHLAWNPHCFVPSCSQGFVHNAFPGLPGPPPAVDSSSWPSTHLPIPAPWLPTGTWPSKHLCPDSLLLPSPHS